MSESIVAFALLCIREHSIRLGRLLELLLRVRVVGVAIRVEFPGQFAISAFEIVVATIAGNPQNLVVVALLHGASVGVGLICAMPGCEAVGLCETASMSTSESSDEGEPTTDSNRESPSRLEQAPAWQGTVDAVDQGQRVDVWLVRNAPSMSRSRAKRWTAAGWVRRNGSRVRKGGIVSAGDRITLAQLADDSALPDPALTLSVLYEDECLVVVDKAAGIPIHPLRSGEIGTLANALIAKYPEMANVGYGPREPGLLHRLDTGTSGVVLAAKTQAAFEQLRQMLGRKKIEKRYEAFCDGTVRAGAFNQPIAHDTSDSRRMIVCADAIEAAERGGRPARTEVLSVQSARHGSQVELVAMSARRHQIRVHLSAAGHPLLGDVLYGGPVMEGLERHALHASRVAFDHPMTGQRIDVTAPLPPDLTQFCG